MVALCGELGSGKTCFVRGVARGLGFDGYVKSPSFTIVNIYEGGRVPIYHVDLYRVADAGELPDLGLDDCLYGEGVTLVEWADRFPEIVPDEALVVKISRIGTGRRRIEIARRGPGTGTGADRLENTEGR